MDNLYTHVTDLLFEVALHQSVLFNDSLVNSGGGASIASIIPKALDANTCRSNDALWKKWAAFCEIDVMDPLLTDEASLLRYLGLV